MPIIRYVYLYLLTIPVFLVIDLLWIGFFVEDFYASNISSLLGEVNIVPALIFYLLFVLGLIIFAVRPALEFQTLHHAILLGALFGFITYATYGLTNASIIAGWPIAVSLTDMIWGGILGGLVSSLSYFIGEKLWL